jgi:hypothetical protein
LRKNDGALFWLAFGSFFEKFRKVDVRYLRVLGTPCRAGRRAARMVSRNKSCAPRTVCPIDAPGGSRRSSSLDVAKTRTQQSRTHSCQRLARASKQVRHASNHLPCIPTPSPTGSPLASLRKIPQQPRQTGALTTQRFYLVFYPLFCVGLFCVAPCGVGYCSFDAVKITKCWQPVCSV